jgi:predicted PurR-regulated permease PerM
VQRFASDTLAKKMAEAPKTPNNRSNPEPSPTAVVNEQKGRVVSIAFTVIAVGIVIAFVTLVGYYNYLMIAPYIVPMLMALLVAMPLAYIRDAFIGTIESVEGFLGLDQRPVISVLCALTVPIASGLIGVGTLVYIPQVFGMLVFPLIAFSFFSVAMAWKSRREFLVTVAVIVFLFVIVLFPMFYLIKSCFEESVVATDAVVKWIKHNHEIQELLADHKNSSIYKQAVLYAQSWGWDLAAVDIEALKEQAMTVVQKLGDHVNVFFGSTLSLLSNIGNIIVGFIVFCTTLFTMVLYKTQIWSDMTELSPFAGEETERIISSIASSISRILLCSTIVGILHFVFTWLSFWWTGLQLKYIFSALCAFLAIVPFSGNWMIWAPAAGMLLARSDYIGAAVIVGAHFIAEGFSAAVMSHLPGNPHLVGMSIALGLSTFGPLGVIVGPLLVGILATVAEIYKGFYSRRQLVPTQSSDLIRAHARAQTSF